MTFKLAHMSDLHAGYRSARHTNAQGINLREVDGYLALAACVKQIIEERVNAAVICGDIFHSPSPSIRAIVFVQTQLRKLAEAGVKVYVLAGNHDSLDVKGDVAASRVLDDTMRGIFSHAEPYVHHEIGPGVNLHMVSHHMYSEQADTMDKIKPIAGEINIFSTHGSVIDPLLKEKLHAEQSPREIVIPEFLLSDKDWSYTLLGHIHERGWVGSRDKKRDTSKKKVYYNGSLIRRGFSDKEVPLGRGWTLWTIGTDGTFVPEHRTVAQRPQMDFKPIAADSLTSAEITEKIVANLRESQVNGTEFDARVAPMLRQRIVNISSAKYASLDWRAINQNTQHALQWAIKQMADESADESERTIDVLSNEEILKSGDMVQIYDEWVKKSDKLEAADEDLRETISKQARGFIELGQEATLEQD